MRTRTPSGNSPLPITAPPSSSADLKRRHFLLTLGAGGLSAASVAVAAVPGSAAAIETQAAAATTDSGYRETDHVRDYYRTARI
jgi:hypothetical protein